MPRLTSKPFVSIVIPVLNERKILPRLLKDLCDQTFDNFEVIVVDANSLDKTQEAALSFQAKLAYLQVFQTPIRNVSYQRNLGSQKALADWLVFMDADNRLPNYFLQGIKYRIELNQPDFFTTFINPDSKSQKDKVVTTATNIYMDLQKNSPTPSVFESLLGFKKDVFVALGGFNPDIPWSEGGDITKRAIERGFKFSLFKDPKYTYSLRRLRAQGTLKSARNSAQLELARILNIPISTHKVKRLYPMEGGQLFESPSSPSSPVLSILKELKNISSLPKEYASFNKLKPGVLKRIKSLLALFDSDSRRK